MLLFFIQGANEQSALTLLLLLALLAAPFVDKNHKLKIPDYFLLAILVYGFYLVLGLISGHPSAHIDIKYQLFGFIFFLAIINQKGRINYLSLLFKINFGVFIIYILLYLGMFPQIWHESTLGRQGRILGPAIISITLILFYYLYHNKPFDKKLTVALLLATVYLMLTSNFTNIVIVFGLAVLIAVNWKKFFSPLYIITAVFILILGLLYLKSSYVPDMVSTKMEYIGKPWEYGSVQTRIQDLQQALRKENFCLFKKIFGEGFGASSQIYRENVISPSLSRTLAFREIDNGFYYLYHRGGWSLLILFVLSHLYMMAKVPGMKAKIGFLMIIFFVNLLTIHYFTNMFYLLIPFLILERVRLISIPINEEFFP